MNYSPLTKQQLAMIEERYSKAVDCYWRLAREGHSDVGPILVALDAMRLLLRDCQERNLTP